MINDRINEECTLRKLGRFGVSVRREEADFVSMLQM